MGFYEFILKIVEYLNLPTIMAIFFMGFFLYDRAVKRIDKSENNLRELVKQSENRLMEQINSLKDLLTATIKPIQEQVNNHIPTQMKAMDEKFDRKFDELYRLLINKDKDVKKEHTKNKEGAV